MKFWLLFVMFGVLGLQVFGVAQAQDTVAQIPLVGEECSGIFCDFLDKFPELSGWLIVAFTAIGLILRAVSETLLWVGSKLNKPDASALGAKLGSFSAWAAQVVGWFGGGTPRALVLKKVAEELEKTRPPVDNGAAQTKT